MQEYGVAAQRSSAMGFAGIDWADKHHDVVVLDVAGQQVLSRRVAHRAAGRASLTAERRARAPAPAEVVVGVVERAHGLLMAALLEAGLWVAPVNPQTVDRTRPASGAKSAQLEALLLARAGRSAGPDLRRVRPDTPVLAELKTLTRDAARLIRQPTRVVNPLSACLKASYPVVTELCDKLTRPVAPAFLRAFPPLAQARALYGSRWGAGAGGHRAGGGAERTVAPGPPTNGGRQTRARGAVPIGA